MAGEWHNYGDVNFTDYGGVMIKDAGDDDYEFFKVVAEGDDKYAFYGTVSRLRDYYGEDAEMIAGICGTTEEWYRNHPEEFVCDLIDNFGCGVFEFNPRDFKNTPYIEYSTCYEDFKVTDEELVSFLAEVGITDYDARSHFEVER